MTFTKAMAGGAFTLLLALIAIVAGDSGASADTSGTNPSGYVWIDSNSPDPTVPFAWVDATDGTLSTVTDDDDDYETLTLPFTFNLFGTDYTEVDLSSNGFLSFDTDNGCNDNYNDDPDDAGHPIPPGLGACDTIEWGGVPLIAGWFDDLDPGECGDVYYKTVGSAPNRQFVAEWFDVCHNDCDDCTAGEGVTWEMILFETSNDIKVQYLDTVFNADSQATGIYEENNGNQATTGVNLDATVGLGYHWATPDLTDNLAVLYTTAAADLEIAKTSSAATAVVGDQITYTLTVTNNGPSDATTATVIDDLPDAVTYVSATPSQGSCVEASSVVTCNLGNLALDATATIQIVVTVNAEGTVQNSASVSATEFDPTPANSTAVADVAVGPNATAVPTAAPTPAATPAQLPETGGTNESGAGLPWIALLALGALGIVAATGGMALALRRID